VRHYATMAGTKLPCLIWRRLFLLGPQIDTPTSIWESPVSTVRNIVIKAFSTLIKQKNLQAAKKPGKPILIHTATKSHNNRMQSDKLLRYAPQFAADARRYALGDFS